MFVRTLKGRFAELVQLIASEAGGGTLGENSQDGIANFLRAGTNIALVYDDVGNNLTIEYLSPDIQYTLNDNSSIDIIVGNVTANRAAFFDYTVTVGSNFHAGQVTIVHDGSNCSMSNQYSFTPNEITGIDCTSLIDGDDIVFRVTATALGGSALVRVKNQTQILK